MFENALLASTAIPVGALIDSPNPSVFAMAGESGDQEIQTWREEMATLLDQADGLAAGDQLTDQDRDQITGLLSQAEDLRTRIETRERVVAARQSAGRRTTNQPVRTPSSGPAGSPAAVPAAPRVADAKGGYGSFGDFAKTVRASCIGDRDASQRLFNTVTTYGGEGTGADGGFLVPPEFQRNIWVKVSQQANLLGMCAPFPIGSNSVVIPKDETAPWDYTNGIQAYWEGEATAPSNTKPQMKFETIRLGKLMAMVPISEELLEDAVAIEGWLSMKAPMKIGARLNTAVVRGTGVGQPKGILTATESLISIAKETSQDAASVWFANIVKMWSRMYAPLRQNAVWLINQDVEPALYQMAFDPEASSKVPVYLPPGGLNNSPYGLLMGRPVVPVESCSAIGTQGDIIFVDLSQYMAVSKAGQDIRQDVSMHLYFDQGLLAYRFTFRVNGMPMWGSTIARENGSDTLSYAITLDARA